MTEKITDPLDSVRLISTEMRDILPMRDRSPGLHVSSIIEYLCIELDYFEEREPGEPIAPQAMLELGNALEWAIAARMAQDDPDRYVHDPGEIEVDGVYMTCDLLDLEPDPPIPGVTHVVEEVKLTWSSSRRGPDDEKFWRYWRQLMAYCRGYETRVGRLHVVHVNGDYPFLRKTTKKDPGEWVSYRLYEGRWSRRELDDNWRMLLGHREAVECK